MVNLNDFTYDSYKALLQRLITNGYRFCFYDECADVDDKECILRHDVDFDIRRSLDLARIENELGVKSTYFILLKTDFYNPISKSSIDMLREIVGLGHSIGLHFDEKSYDENCDVVQLIKTESDILGKALSFPIRYVSMHRPSQKTLESNYVIEGIINSYSHKFFKEYKYVSDSRRNWRENVYQIVNSKQFGKLHILTHAFWYHDKKSNIKNDLLKFVNEAKKERFVSLADNITNFGELLDEGDIL